jgi:hypothetical protein
MCRQDVVDEGLVAHAAAARFFAELVQHTWIDADRDELARFVSKGRPTDSAYRPQLLSGRIGNVGKVNLSRRTPRARGGSLAAR